MRNMIPQHFPYCLQFYFQLRLTYSRLVELSAELEKITRKRKLGPDVRSTIRNYQKKKLPPIVGRKRLKIHNGGF